MIYNSFEISCPISSALLLPSHRSVRKWADEHDFHLSNHYLEKMTPSGSKLLECQTDRDIFRLLGLPIYIPPHLRNH